MIKELFFYENAIFVSILFLISELSFISIEIYPFYLFHTDEHYYIRSNYK